MPNVPIAVTVSGATALVAAVSQKKIRVWGYSLMAYGAVGVKFQSSATDLTGLYAQTANGGIVEPSGMLPIFDCNANEALNINLDTAVTVGGRLMYELLPG